MSVTAVILAFSACHWAIFDELCSCSSASSRSSASLRFLEASSFSLRSDVSSISSCIARRLSSSISSGIESISMRRREAASSMRSIALSGRKRSAM